MFSITTGAALEATAFFVVSNVAIAGVIKRSVLDGLMLTVKALKERIDALEVDAERLTGEALRLTGENAAMRSDLLRLHSEGDLTTRRLAVSLRVIDFFERVVTVVIKGRSRLPDDLAEQIDAGLRDLAQFRDQAALDLESMEVNRPYYVGLAKEVSH